ncbi:MAG TPA: site-2 protease family protein [Anaerolineales bacterium]|nr:site-2 protease family protein [Anaerolineales bacterium]
MFGQLFSDPLALIPRLIVLVVALTVHEFAHAWTADRFGDGTPRANGRLTLNPLSHLDPIGSLVFLLAGFGWAKPVPVNLYALERSNRLAPVWVAFAGPLSNFILAIIFAIPLRFGLLDSAPPLLADLFVQFVWLNLILMVFNLIPIFPLDGEKVLTYLLPPESSLRRLLDQIRPVGPMILLFLIVAGPLIGLDLLGILVSEPVSAMFAALVGIG